MSVNKYYWDSGVFSALFNAEVGRVDNCKRILKAAESGVVTIYTSSIAIVEVVYVKPHTRLSRASEVTIREFFENDYIIIIDANRKVAEDARQLLWEYPHLQYKDAIHVASAVIGKVDGLHSYDTDLTQLTGKLGEPALRIDEPGTENNFSLEPAS